MSEIGMSSYLLLKFSMLRRYRKLQEDMPLISGEDRGRYFGKRVFYIKTNVIYLPLSPSIFLYLPFISVAFLQRHIPVAFVLAICSPVFHLCVLCAALSYKGGFVLFRLLRLMADARQEVDDGNTVLFGRSCLLFQAV